MTRFRFFQIIILHILYGMHILVTWGTLHETAVAGLQPDDQAAHSIVQVYSVVNEPYYSIPWVTSPESNETGTGSIISGYRIITSAHLVADSRSVKVRKASANRQYEAYIVFVSHESDLAILRVHDMGFFSNTVPLEIAPGAASQKKVRVYGFPDEERLNITDGILTDNRRRLYRHSSSTLLAGELLSLIEPGYSGGPVMYDGMIVGIVMQANNAGTVAHTVPVPVIRHFLNDIEDGSYNGFPHLGLITDHRDNLLTEDNTARHGLPGICINRVAEGSPAEGKIDIQDRLVSINGRTVFPDGTVELEPNVFTHYETEIEQYQVGDDIHVQILRSGEIKDIVVSLDTVRTDFMLVPPEQYDTHPRYFIFGGLIFSPLTKNILNEWNSESDNLRERISAWGTRDKEEIVAVINVLPAEVNREYREMAGWIVDSVNGFSIKSFDELYRMIESSDDPLVTFSDEQGSQIAIDRQMALASHKRILETYGITQDRSSDLLTASDNIRLISAIEHITKSSY